MRWATTASGDEEDEESSDEEDEESGDKDDKLGSEVESDSSQVE